MAHVTLALSTLPQTLAVCRLDPGVPMPEWAWQEAFCSITRTADELSIICEQSAVPEGVKCERDWRALKLDGPLDFNLVGVLASILEPLAEAAIGILAVGTYDTDYVLVKAGQYERALVVLAAAGHRIQRSR